MRYRLAAGAAVLLAVLAWFPVRGGGRVATAMTTTLILDIHTIQGAATVPVKVAVKSKERTLETLFARANLTIVRRDAVLPNVAPGRAYDDAELHALLKGTVAIGTPAQPSEWHIRGFAVPRLASGGSGYRVVGLMFDLRERGAFAVASQANEARFLRTVAHELGHVLNLFHSDGDADLGCCGNVYAAAAGASIMNDENCTNGADFDLVFSAKELAHLTSHDPAHVRPGTCYGTCEPRHVELCPGGVECRP